MRNNNHYLLLLWALLLFACKGTDEPTLTFETITTDKEVMLSSEENSPRCQVHLNLLQATAENGEKAKIINEALMARLLNKPGEKDLQTAAEKFTEDYTTSYKNTMLPLYNQDRADTAKIAWYEYHYIIDATTQQGTANTISYLATIDYYEGGAHGINQLITFNFDIATGKVITLADVFAPGYESQLKNSLLKALKSKTGLNSMNELKEAGYLYSMEMFASENFILNDETITFVYNPYEIAPYAVGSIELVITYSEVSQILNPSFKH